MDDLSALERAKGNYEEAIRLGLRCCDLYKENFSEETVSSSYAYLSLGRSYSATGDYDKADEYLNRALKLDLEFLGVASLQTVFCREVIADNAYARRDFKKAAALYMDLEMDLEKYFGEMNPQTVRIREKRMNIPEADAGQNIS